MFNSMVSSNMTEVTSRFVSSAAADELCWRRFYVSYDGLVNVIDDCVPLICMRLLLDSRVPKDRDVKFYTFGSLSNVYKNIDIKRNMMERINLNDITLFYYNEVKNDIDDLLDLSPKNLLNNDFKEAKDLREFWKNAGYNMYFFINKKEQKTVVYASYRAVGGDHHHREIISALFPRLLPWFFEENPINEKEKMLINSIVKYKEPDTFIGIVDEICKEKYNFRELRIRDAAKRFSTEMHETEISRASEELRNIDRAIEDNLRSYEQYMKNRRISQARYDGLVFQLNNMDDVSETLIDYLCQNKRIDDLELSNRGSYYELKFIVSDYLEYFDPDIFMSMKENTGSYLYDRVRSGDLDKAKKILSYIFSNKPILRVRMCGVYYIDIMSCNCHSQNSYAYPTKYNTSIPNPHLDRHDCLGDNRRYIVECLANGNLLGAIEQCCSSVRSLNLGESVTAAPFVEKLLYSRRKAIELPDGTMCDAEEAYKWIQKYEKSKEDNKNGETN